MATEIRVPTLGESVTEATIGTWLKKKGDTVSADEPLVELETDKVTLEVPAPAAGTLSEIVANEGDTVEVDALLGSIEAEGAGGGSAGNGASGGGAKAKAETTSASAKKDDAGKAANGGGSGKGSGKMVDVPVPAAGESVTSATVGEVFKKVGDEVKMDEPLLELETDKAAQEVPSPAAGVVRELLVEQGQDVEVGELLLRIEEGATGGSAGASHEKGEPATPNGPGETPSPREGGEKKGGTDMPPAPSAKKMMEEKNVSSDQVVGSGKRGQVLKGDVMDAVNRASPSSPAEEPKVQARAKSSDEDSSREERVKMTRLRQTIAKRLKGAQNTAAMLTTYNEVDMKPVMDLRAKYKELFEKKHGVKLGFMGFFTKAVTHALKEVPAVNAEIDGTDIIYKNFAHIGVAVGTDRGLVVPVVRDADAMSIAGVEKEINRLGKAARDGQLSMADMQGGTFTISNGGVYGSLLSSPILNAPQSGILGMHKIQERPVAIKGEVVIRPMMYLAVSYDHRIVDGKEAVTFLVRVKEVLEDPERLVLDL
ncbi:2-oxoglutarate dehydrogenase complex dihydrolipoyllysine-residue succinyltransferase [Pararhizobium mangrovi]|uniref:Dihydrolipoyllysine-residue succinyltransferase component of 2-oxoglutarate dehydrogenase complex n=1 Tax=Pararhizobium mangrovi TaxID=2590452 RepID=A0A506U7V3_9HYPH|nr:2-oxoglutarate dehydrogenase complex dihydrolipoyllysine-residue succinyltransferase [Pararhizobium mangrovi]TPW27967.1 2-oxoglutarate dehydrogenase complex dihydrolipoyllysine-residue succinyltransferase [Pararhizobium mangrovi]